MYKDRDGTKYTVVLSKTDVVAKKNSYYKLQILKDNSKDKWVHLQIKKNTHIKKNTIEIGYDKFAFSYKIHIYLQY